MDIGPVHAEAEPGGQGGGRDPAPKTIVLLADGTGNAFSKQASNVWRIYEALDLGRSAQVACYIPGVGTSGFRPWALIDGATGFGVPSNVRRLYEFLCWNYRPGDRIVLFGFSRGAFTIRTLIGLIDSEGLLSTQGQHGTASRPEMRRNVMSAWRAYRAKRRQSRLGEAPTIKLTRLVRNALLLARDRFAGYERYPAVQARADHEAKIAFAGLFDTVEAYGVPLEEMRDAIDWAIWPITFRNRVLSRKVARVRHALSLDDERQTFHPVRFNQTGETDGRIEEVWFAGVHSDVGGGYPDDTAALVPLGWVLEGAAGQLSFRPGAVDGFAAAASSLASVHDSRSGLANLYRYFPRVIGMEPKDGGPPVVHHSVIEKMVFGSDRYAPHALPAQLKVLMPDGSLRPMHGMEESDVLKKPSRPRLATRSDTMADEALAVLGQPIKAFVDLVHDGTWLRRKVYFLLLFGVLAFACLPWGPPLLGIEERSSSGETLTLGGTVAKTNHVLIAWVQDIATTVASVVPSYLQPWVKTAVARPLLTLTLLAVIAVLYVASARLRDHIADDARCAWFGPGGTDAEPLKRGAFLRLVHWLRLRQPRPSNKGLIYWAWFAATLVAFVSAAFLYTDRVVLSYRVGAGHVCTLDRGQKPRPVTLATPESAEGFAASNPCWDSGLYLDKGLAYEITITTVEPFRDRTTVADLDGFTSPSWRRWSAAPLRRWFSAAYFQPIARIGDEGMSEWVLKPDSGEEPRHLDRDADVHASGPATGGVCGPVPADPQAVETIRARFDLQSALTSRFVAPASGELYLYVNDAMFGSDWLARLLGFGHGTCFYGNNSGSAKVTVRRLPAQTP